MLEIPPPRCHMRQRCDAPMTRSMREDVALQRRRATMRRKLSLARKVNMSSTFIYRARLAGFWTQPSTLGS